MITTQELISKFQYALDNDWGYIWGEAGDIWTAVKQANATREQTKLYGKKWIGHHVADCSGLFNWAFKQLGGYIYHGSNTMYKSYCTAKGTLSKGKRTDGMELKPGTAVFTGTENDHGHVGLFIGNGYVIEAKGTQAGVVMTKITDKRWTFWGELKGVDYGGNAEKPNVSDSGFPESSVWHSTIRRGDKGRDVTDCQTMLFNLGYSLGSYGIDGDFGRATEAAVKEFQQDHKLTVDGVCGPMTWDALEKATANISGKPVEKSYTVCIHGLDKTQADALKNNYPGATVTEE